MAISGGGLYNYAGNTTFKKRVTMEDNEGGNSPNFFVQGGGVTFEKKGFGYWLGQLGPHRREQRRGANSSQPNE